MRGQIPGVHEAPFPNVRYFFFYIFHRRQFDGPELVGGGGGGVWGSRGCQTG
jgi:hypothetical protein